MGPPAAAGSGSLRTPGSNDGLLDVTFVKPISVPRLLWHLPKVFQGTLERVERYASMKRMTKLRIESTEPVPVHVDGEVYRGDTSRLDIEVIPNALTVIGNFGPPVKSKIDLR